MRKALCRLRISAHNLPIEKGRHRRPKKTPVNERFCDMCTIGVCGTEMHTIISCPTMDSDRKTFFDKIKTYNTDFCNMTDDERFIYIMQCNIPELAKDLIVFLKRMSQKRGSL